MLTPLPLQDPRPLSGAAPNTAQTAPKFPKHSEGEPFCFLPPHVPLQSVVDFFLLACKALFIS